LTDQGPVRIDTPRDSNRHFEPRLLRKGQRRLAGLDEKIVALYTGGMTTRAIDTLHRRSVRARSQSRDGQPGHRCRAGGRQGVATRPPEAVYPILYLDPLVIKIRDGDAVRETSPATWRAA
jgi:transposase-like protein